MNPTIRTLIVWVAIFVVVILLWNAFQTGRMNRQKINYSEFITDVRAGRVEEAVPLVEHLLETPSHLSPSRLRIDPEWVSIRRHPRIEEIIHDDTVARVDQGRPTGASG